MERQKDNKAAKQGNDVLHSHLLRPIYMHMCMYVCVYMCAFFVLCVCVNTKKRACTHHSQRRIKAGTREQRGGDRGGERRQQVYCRGQADQDPTADGKPESKRESVLFLFHSARDRSCIRRVAQRTVGSLAC